MDSPIALNRDASSITVLKDVAEEQHWTPSRLEQSMVPVLSLRALIHAVQPVMIPHVNIHVPLHAPSPVIRVLIRVHRARKHAIPV